MIDLQAELRIIITGWQRHAQSLTRLDGLYAQAVEVLEDCAGQLEDLLEETP